MFMEATVIGVLCVLLTVYVSPAAAGQLLGERGSVCGRVGGFKSAICGGGVGVGVCIKCR